MGPLSWRRLSAVVLMTMLATTTNAQFVDDFSRPDSAVLGNGWIEKDPAAFDLVGGMAAKQASGGSYLDTAVYRPAGEDTLDEEVTVELQLLSTSPGYPQIFSRLQSSTAGIGGTLDGYILYIDNRTDRAILGRQTGSAFVTPLATITMAPALNTVDTYRMRLRSTGTLPVQLDASIERFNGSGWDVIGSASTSDSAAAVIAAAGSAGFGGYQEASYRYDNFSRTPVGAGSNPIPISNTLIPANATEGGSAFSLTVNGSNFIPGSVVRWNGADRGTTYVSANELQATITAADIAAAGTATVTVFNPAPGGGSSGGVTFTIDPGVVNNPVPAATSLNPSAATEGGSAFTLTVNGNNFIPGSVVRWNGVDRGTTYISANVLQATITAADIATAGTATVTVFNPAPGGGSSGGLTFTIDPGVVNNPVPAAGSLNPTSATEGGSAFSLTVNGSNFIPGSVVRWNGADRGTTFVSANVLQATITAADIATAGSATVSVFNPAPGGGSSGNLTFTIDPAVVNNPVPATTSLNPSAATEGGSAFTLSVNGSNFIPGSIVRWNGADRGTTYISANVLQATIAAADIATAGSVTVSVFNPAPGGGTSNATTFTITTAGQGFLDTFSRPDSAVLGNGWIEKDPAAFDLVGGMAAKQASGGSYLDTAVYRPAGEDTLDEEVTVELQLLSTSPGYPQIFSRLQSSTAGIGGTLDGYILYIDNRTDRAILGRQTGSAFVTPLATITMAPALNTVDTYRMRLRSTGTLPVQLDASIERFNGSGWDVIGSASTSDSAAAVIAAAGSAGFGGYQEASYRYDNFSRTPVGAGSNPIPISNTLIPANATEGGSAFSLTVNGSNFIPGSVVRWNGADRGTTYVSANELQATITAADIAAAGTATVTVFNPAPGGGSSGGVTFTIDPGVVNNPVPAATSLNPSAATEGGSAFTLTVNGNNFIPGSVVRWNGVDRGTTYISANVLQATITAADIATAGTATVTVFNPAPGGGSSGGLTFTIDPGVVNNPVPAAGSLNPTSATEGGSAFSLTVNGSNFIPGSVVRWNGADRGTTFVSANVLQATITAADIATAGSATVSVFNPAPGGGSSGNLTFTIDPAAPLNPAPEIAGLSPIGQTSGGGSFTLTVNGSGFSNDSVVMWNNQPRTTTYVSGLQLEAQIGSADIASADTPTVTIVTPAPGGGTSNPYPFFVADSNTSYLFDDFQSSDSPDIGNGWTEKYPDAFFIQDNQVNGIETPYEIVWTDNLVYRPTAEDRLDVELSIEFVRTQIPGFPQLHARAQRGTIAVPNTLRSYMLFVHDNLGYPGGIVLAVGTDQTGIYECFLELALFPSPLVTDERYRLRFEVSGTDPVQLDGYLDRWDSTEWQQYTSITAQHDDSTQPSSLLCSPGYMPAPIRTAGAMGFSKYWDQPDIYDNFYWIDMASNPAVPDITGTVPASTEEGQPAFTLMVSGSNFVPSSQVLWNGTPRPTSFVSSTTLQADIPANDIAVASTASVSVSTPAPGGGVSGTVPFTIYAAGQQPNPVPSVSGTSPTAVVSGSGPLQLSILGNDFAPNSVVRWNNSDLPTSYQSSTALTATVDAARLANVGSAAITVFSPPPSGGLSGVVSVAVIQTGEVFDDFNRADSTQLGNGWIEKSDPAFQIVNNELLKAGVSSGYLDNIAYRPANEESQNSDASVEFRLTDTSPGYPQLFTRLQSATAANSDELDGYVLYINNSTGQAILGRQTGSDFVTALATVNFSEALNLASTYRMRLQANGTNPVSVTGTMERLTTSGFVTIGVATAQDNAANRIVSPGVSGVGGYVEQSYIYDNFRHRTIN